MSTEFAAPRTRASEEAAADLRVAVVVAVVLAALGAVIGLVWSVWSPPGPAAQVLGGGLFIPDETEAFVAGDGRYLVLAAAIGVLAALLTWFARAANRGPVVLIGLGVGAAAGALLTELVGHLTGGGSFTGKVFTYSDGGKIEITRQLPLSLHAQGLLLIEPAVAALVYGLFVAFAVRDDLGRPDPVRGNTVAPSVGAAAHPQDGGGYGDAPGAPQQGDLAPQ